MSTPFFLFFTCQLKKVFEVCVSLIQVICRFIGKNGSVPGVRHPFASTLLSRERNKIVEIIKNIRPGIRSLLS